MNIFKGPYKFIGEHGYKVRAISHTSTVDKIFDSAMELYLVAPLIGYIYGKKSEINTVEYGNEDDVEIFRETMETRKDKIEYNYKLIMLLDEINEPDLEKRIDKAFRGKRTEHDNQLFESYIRGGVDILYDVITENATNIEDKINNIYYFLDDFERSFNIYFDK